MPIAFFCLTGMVLTMFHHCVTQPKGLPNQTTVADRRNKPDLLIQDQFMAQNL
jgi:hypothetical protein